MSLSKSEVVGEPVLLHKEESVEISTNIEGISRVTSQSADDSEKMSVAAEEMNRQTEALRVLVNQFTLERSPGEQSVRHAVSSMTEVFRSCNSIDKTEEAVFISPMTSQSG